MRSRGPACERFKAVEARTAVGSAGVAHDVSEIVALRAKMERDGGRLLADDRSAVDRGRGIFDKSKRLTLYNAAYRQIWSLEPAFPRSRADRR